MSLRQLAQTDLNGILKNTTTGFGWPITLTNPNGNSVELVGNTNDIAQVIDPDTGQAVSGRLASITLPTESILAAGFEYPRGIADSGSKPWVVEFKDINGNDYKFKISQSNPDRTIGAITCLLEVYE